MCASHLPLVTLLNGCALSSLSWSTHAPIWLLEGDSPMQEGVGGGSHTIRIVVNLDGSLPRLTYFRWPFPVIKRHKSFLERS